MSKHIASWRDKHSARRVLSWAPEKGQDVSINYILPALVGVRGSVLEIGPGSGNLLKYLPHGIQYTCIEPNTYLHEAIRTEATKCGFSDIRIVTGKAETMPFESGSFDVVVSVRSLCSMDTALVLQQVKQTLKVGGKFIFVEHVVAPRGSLLWLGQKLICYPHKLLRGGCDPSKDIGAYIEEAGFSKLDIERFDVEGELAKSRVAGVGTK